MKYHGYYSSVFKVQIAKLMHHTSKRAAEMVVVAHPYISRFELLFANMTAVGGILRVLGMEPYTQAPKPNTGSYGKLIDIRKMHVISTATFTATLQCSYNHVPVRAPPMRGNIARS